MSELTTESAAAGKTRRFVAMGAALLLSAAALVLLGGREMRNRADVHAQQRRLYESDNDDDGNCLEDEGCRFVLGLACLVLVPFLICWNEIKFVKLETLYRAAQRLVHDLDDDIIYNDHSDEPPPPPHESLDGKFVCFSGRLSGETTLQDEIFPSIAVQKSLLLAREIEILQYVDSKEDNQDPVLEWKWFPLPQKNPKYFKDKKNPIGNWNLLADPHRMVGTGHTLDGQPIEFGDNITIVHRTSEPTIGSFVLPTALMNEIFLGTRHVHRLGELELIKSSQGTWEYVNLDNEQLVNKQDDTEFPRHGAHLWNNNFPRKSRQQTLAGSSTIIEVKDGVLSLPCGPCHKLGEYVYDGPSGTVGTIRMRWKFVAPQNLSVAAEAVAPGRPSELGYGTNGTQNVYDHGVVLRMVKDELVENCNDCCCGCCEEGEKQGLLIDTMERTNAASVPSKQWTVTPFTVTTPSWMPPSFDRRKVLGKLWLYGPGLLNSQELFQRANRSNIQCLWKIRSLSYVLLILGWCLVFEPLSNIFRSIPVFRALLSLTFAGVAFVLATICCTGLTLLARITARPIQSITIISALWATILFILQ